MVSNLSPGSVSAVFKESLAKGLLREEDTLVMFHDLGYLRERIEFLQSVFPSTAIHGIAMKANPLIRLLDFLKGLGTGIEVASFGELMVALKTGYAPEKIIYDSPVKTMQELEYALEAGVHVNLDSFTELERVSILKEKKKSSGTIGIRINPQVGAGSIAESSVAGEYSKFGVPIKTRRDELTAAFEKYSWLTGVHLHVGSQGCPLDLLLRGIGILYDFANEINSSLGREQVRIFDIGGGLPISYDRKKKSVSMKEYADTIRKNFPSLFTVHYSLFTEFGRWVHVNTGWTISRVESVKHDPGINTAMIHAGADLFLRECLLPGTWPHEYSVLDPMGNLKAGSDPIPWNLAGPLCFSGDILARHVLLPEVTEGDFIVIHDTGGYTLSMWSRYNSRQLPRVIGYEGSSFEILKERETTDQLYEFWK